MWTGHKISHLKNAIITGGSYLFILLFLYAAISKLLDFETFTVQLAQSPLFSAYAGIIAWLVPALEIIIAVLLVFERFRIPALFAAFALMVMFTAYIVIILNFSDFIPCSCGGVLEKLSWTQHLIFNAFFILLAGVAVFFTVQKNAKKTLLMLTTLAIFGVGTITLLFAFSEKKMHRNNAFQRRYIPHAIEAVHEYKLEGPNYYIAGMDQDKIYLGNYMAPLLLVEFSVKQRKIDKKKVTISNLELPYRRVRIEVKPPYFYLGDGTIPIVFRGSLQDKMGYPDYSEAHFLQFVIADSSHLGIVSIDDTIRKTKFGVFSKENENSQVKFNDNILSRQVDGVIGMDGTLLWNERHQQFMYVYRYRNTFEAIDKTLNHLYTGRTIDTIGKAILGLAHYNKTNQYALGAKSVVVNKLSATDGDYLFIESERLGKFDNEDSMGTTDIIDVYNIVDQTYAFSFRLYHDKGKQLKGFKVYGELLVAIFGDTLIIYKLKPTYFNAGSNRTHTAQYQEEDRTPVKNSRSLIH